MVDEPGPAQPRSPVARRGRHPIGRVVDVRGGFQALGPGERAIEPLALSQHVAGPYPIALDAERHVGPQPHGLVGAARVGRVAVAVVDQCPLGRRAAVVERGLADELDLNVPLEAEDRPDQHVIRVLIGRRPRMGGDPVVPLRRTHRQRITHDHPATRRVPGREQDVRPGLVDPRHRHVDPERPQPERARRAIQQRPEDAWRVKPRNAEPVDCPIGRHQRARVAVREERVLLDRRKRRGRRRALRRGRNRRLAVTCRHGAHREAAPLAQDGIASVAGWRGRRASSQAWITNSTPPVAA
jgi:hypothetical protein